MSRADFTTSLSNLATVVTNTAGAVTTFCRHSRDSRSDLLAITGELSQLQLIVELLRDDTAVIDDRTLPADVHTRALTTIDNCSDVTEKISTALGGEQRWTFDVKSKVNNLRELLKAHRDTLHIALDAVALLALKSVKDGRSRVSVTVLDIESEEAEEEISTAVIDIPKATSTQPRALTHNLTQAVDAYTGAVADDDSLAQNPSLTHNPFCRQDNRTAQWNEIFGRLDRDQNGVITGDEALPFFQTLNLPTQMLAEIWAEADKDNQGYLTKEQFALAMDLVCQERVKQMFAKLDKGEKGYLLAEEAAPFFDQSCLPARTLGNIWAQVDSGNKGYLNREEFSMALDLIRQERLVDAEDRARFDEVFDRLDAGGTGVISGEQASLFLNNSKLSADVLGWIWELADIDGDGYLDKDEFAMAMHLVKQQRMGITRLPRVVIKGARFFDS
ncbi:hypothetical protein QBC40DRAFT_307913 [Triangularia verruculosa]|uniref:Calmodulin n=1 Tax=Triangularia verruculosa TaxID=2587418 RepID=A0AAN7AUA1_9PEZI|nr:hypothetical protein QBC40DRAFT_307913 [Triangularia verruculosa]